MAWTNDIYWKDSVTDWGYNGTPYGDGNYSNQWKSITAEVWSSGDTIYYKVTTSANGSCYASVYLSIAGSEIYNGYYTSGITTNGFNSGTCSFTSDEPTIDIDLRLLTSQNWNSGNTYDRFNNKADKKSASLTRTWYTDGTAPSEVTIRESHPQDSTAKTAKNLITFSGDQGTEGTSNELSSTTLYWTTDGTTPSVGTTPTATNFSGSHSMKPVSGDSYAHTIEIPSNCSQIKVFARSVFKYNSVDSNVATKTVAYATQPAVTSPIIDYSKNRLTIKEPWRVSWTGTNGINCNIFSYRLRFFRIRDNKSETIQVYDTNGNQLTTHLGYSSDGETDYGYAYDYVTSSLSPSIIIDPARSDIQPGDIIQISIFSRGRIPTTQTEWWSNYGHTHIYSAEYVVQNAGIVRVKVKDKWEEGQVYVKVGDKWEEAETVQVKIDNKWYESE